MLDRGHAGLDQLVVDGGIERVILGLAIVDGDARPGLNLMQDARQIHALGFPMGDGFFMSILSTRPIISAMVRKPSCAMISRSSSATKKK